MAFESLMKLLGYDPESSNSSPYENLAKKPVTNNAVVKANPTPTPKDEGSFWDMFTGGDESQAAPSPKPSPVDPYENFNNRIKGLPYK